MHKDVRQTLTRIDAIIHQLEVLRRELAATTEAPPAFGRTKALFGAAGKGTRDEYDLDLDWARFNDR